MARITLSVPNELQVKMEKYKDVINFSKVFQETIAKKIDEKDAFKERIKTGEIDVESIVARLKKQKAEDEERFFDDGVEEGFRWAQIVSYAKLVYAAGKFELNGSWYTDPILGEDLVELVTDQQGEVEMPKSLATCFLRGWLEGVRNFWNEVRHRL